MGSALRRKVAAKAREEEFLVKSSPKREVQLPRGGRVSGLGCPWRERAQAFGWLVGTNSPAKIKR